MGKRVKKKGRTPQKEKRGGAHSPKVVPQQSKGDEVTVEAGVTAPKERKQCPHFEKGFVLEKLAEKLGSSSPCRCEDCREGGADRRGAKGKAKQGKKKGNASVDSKSEPKAIWICLECGHYACGGIGFPTTNQTHAVRHARQTRHPLVIQWENPHLRWCFTCNMLILVEKIEGSGEKKDALSDVVKLIKGQPFEDSSVDVEGVWFGDGSIASEIKAQDTLSRSLEGRGGYIVRGLVNLGNTCFFNSVLQNLLAMDKLRDFFFNQDASFGPLSSSLKKLFLETKPEAGLKNVMTPKSLFAFVCSKAPQFRGYQQQDSHELLRYLLDGLSTEELAVRKQINASGEDGATPKLVPTFFDMAFGGQISSTVQCIECGYSSTVYEPFLDLSLPVPTKKPAVKKTQSVSRAKKTKLPPKKGGRIRPKSNKGTESVAVQSVSNVSVSSESHCPSQLNAAEANRTEVASSDASVFNSMGPANLDHESHLVSQKLTAVSECENGQVTEVPHEEHKVASSDDLTWMYFLDSGTSFDEDNVTLQDNDISVSQDPGEKESLSNDGIDNGSLFDGGPNIKPDSSWVNPWEDEVPLQVQSSEVLLLPYKDDSFVEENTKVEAEASSSFMGCGQGDADLDGLGDLFNEPEVSTGPVAGPLSGPEIAETGFIAGNLSESDPDEVDDTDSPVSVDSCLSHFIKPELLCKDNAWECENCSKVLQYQRLEAKKKQAEIVSKPLVNGSKTQVAQIDCHPRSLVKNISCPTDGRNLRNGDVSTHRFINSAGASIVADNGKADVPTENCIKTEGDQTDEPESFVSLSEDKKVDMNSILSDQSCSSGQYETCTGESSSGPANDSFSTEDPSSTGYTTAKDQHSDSQISGNCESEENGDDEKPSEKVKVKRDANKRVLIDKAPPILTIHLKRFSHDARGRLSKLNGHVNFSDILDLRPYLDARCKDADRYVYRLLGVVEHLGTLRGGHYIAYVRGEKGKSKEEKDNGSSVWFYTSDNYVREVSLEEVLRCEAYILFYEKI